MGAEQALLQVRADLCDRIDKLAFGMTRLNQAQRCGEIDEIRQIAQRYQLTAVALLARAMEAALANGDRGALLNSHLELMREALGAAGLLSDSATEAFLAAASVRLADPTLFRH